MHDVLSCAGQRAGLAITEVVCDRSPIMADEEPSSLSVRVFMIEKKSLWYEFEHVDSQVPKGTFGQTCRVPGHSLKKGQD